MMLSMINNKIIFLTIAAGIYFYSCRQEHTDQTKVIVEQKASRVISPINGVQVKSGDEITFAIAENNSSDVIDSIKYSINRNAAGISTEKKFIYKTKNESLGAKQIAIEVFLKNKPKDLHSLVVYILSDKKPVDYTYKIIKVYPHDPTSYTQGLVYLNGFLYESTGLNKRSKLRKVNYTNGLVLKEIKLDDSYFGEGIAIANKQIYQLTWNEKIGFIYTLDGFKVVKHFNLPSSEGWGMAFDGKQFLSSDGSNVVYFLDTASLAKTGEIQVMDDKGIVDSINEMEYVDGVIYANVYQTNLIVIIDSKTGKVIGRIDCSGLLKEEDKHADIDVLNGIAYLPQSKHFLITGKNWPKLFEVVWVKK
jgi:glutaminyl-peptide cyclotransferase